MPPLAEQSSDHGHSAECRQIDEAAVQAFRCAGRVRRWEANAPAPAFELGGERHDCGKADQGQHGPARRHPQQAIQREAEIDEHENVDRHHVGKHRRAVGQKVEGEAAEPDQEDERDEEHLVSAPRLLRAAQQQPKGGERRQQEGGIACGIERLGREGLARAALAIEEHVLA